MDGEKAVNKIKCNHFFIMDIYSINLPSFKKSNKSLIEKKMQNE